MARRAKVAADPTYIRLTVNEWRQLESACASQVSTYEYLLRNRSGWASTDPENRARMAASIRLLKGLQTRFLRAGVQQRNADRGLTEAPALEIPAR